MKTIHPAIAEHVMEENERLREVLRCIADLPMDRCSTENDYRLSAAKAIALGALSQQDEPAPAQDERALCSEERPCIPCFTDNGGCATAGSEELEKELFEAFWERRHGKKPVRYPGGQCVSDSALWAEIAWNERAALSAQGASK